MHMRTCARIGADTEPHAPHDAGEVLRCVRYEKAPHGGGATVVAPSGIDPLT